MTGVDWAIIALALLFGFWGYQQGFLVGLLTLVGFTAGVFLGSRIGPALLPDGSSSPYAPVTALAGAILVGGIVAIMVEEYAWALRGRVVSGSQAEVFDGVGGAALAAAIALGLAWMFGAVALNAPGAKELRKEVQRSTILAALNEVLPPSGWLLNTLNRIDPGTAITGPDVKVPPPDPRLSKDPQIDDAGDRVVKVLGTACGLGVSGSGWVAGPDLVATNAHVIAGEEDTTVSPRDSSEHLDATPVYFDSQNDLALLRVGALDISPLRLDSASAPRTAGAVIGYPESGPYNVQPARLGVTQVVITQDAYGRGPIRRLLTALRGLVREGNSGGPVVDGDGEVLTTVFSATRGGGPKGGYGVPNSIVRDALGRVRGQVDTGPCTH